MFTGWLDKAGRFTVEHRACPQLGSPVNQAAPAAGVLHTTEGSFEGSLGVFTQHYAPHFMVGKDKAGKVRIMQLVPLGMESAALEHRPGYPATNEVARAQIELVGFSKQAPWFPEADVAEALAALMAELSMKVGIPLRRPFPDGMPREILASTSFSRRSSGKWGKVAGWYGHVEIPGNEHWDPGNLIWTRLLGMSRSMLPKPVVVPLWFTSAKKLAPMWAWFAWKDHGAPKAYRPAQCPKIIPPAWWVRYRLHVRAAS